MPKRMFPALAPLLPGAGMAADLGATPPGGTPDQVGVHLRAEAARRAEAVRRQGIRAA